MSAPAFGVTDVLALGADWEIQSNSPASSGSRVTAAGPDGDVVAENTHNVVEAGTATYIYTQTTAPATDFPAAFAANSCDIGDLVDSNTLQIVGISVDYSPCASGKRPLVTFSYRDGPTAAPATPYVYVSALSTALPTYAAANVVVPEILVATLGSAEIQNSQWSMSAQFGEDLDKDGDYLASAIYGAEETVNQTFVGTPTSIASSGWQATTAPGSNTGEATSNTGYGQSVYGWARGVTRT